MCAPGEDSYEKRLTYYYIGHFSRYIKEGAVKIGTSRYTDGIEVTAFLNPDGERVAVILNKSEKEVPYRLREMTKDAGYRDGRCDRTAQYPDNCLLEKRQPKKRHHFKI